jgi:hypothetical protein
MTKQQKQKQEQQKEIDNFNRLDDKIADLLHEVDQIVEETDKPTDYAQLPILIGLYWSIVRFKLCFLILDQAPH